MKPEKIKVYSIKYPSKGIVEMDALSVEPSRTSPGVTYAHFRYELQRVGTDCFLTREEAVRAAVESLTKKLASLEKQMRKTEKLRDKLAAEQEGR